MLDHNQIVNLDILSLTYDFIIIVTPTSPKPHPHDVIWYDEYDVWYVKYGIWYMINDN